MKHLNYDSILTAVDSNVINSSEFYAQGKDLPDHGLAMAERGYFLSTDSFVLCALLFLFALMAVTLYSSRSIILFQLRGLFSTERKFSLQSVRYKDTWVYGAFILISIAALSFSLSCFHYLQGRYQFSSVLGIPYWLFALGYVLFMLFFYSKVWLYILMNWVFTDHESSYSWLSGYLLLTSLLAVLVFPISLLDLFTVVNGTIVLSCYLFVILLYEFLLVFKLFVNFWAKKYGSVLIILYFCSVELVPALILWHLLVWASDIFVEANVLY